MDNFSYWKNDVIAINGYDENYEGWGGEDDDISIRLSNLGLLAKKLRYIAIVYHIFHTHPPKVNIGKNENLYLIAKQKKSIKCKNGIDKYL